MTHTCCKSIPQPKHNPFARQLNGCGFEKIRIRPNIWSFYHPLFLRNKPDLIRNIKREKLATNEKSSLTEQQLEKISEERPLPKRMKTVDLLRIKEINLNKANVQIMKQTSFPKPPAEQIASRDHSASVSVLEDEVVGTEGHALSIPTFIYTPSPHPLPPFINTVAPALSSGNVQHQNVDRVQPPTQGTVYTQSHAPHVGVGIPSSQANRQTSNIYPPFQSHPYLHSYQAHVQPQPQLSSPQPQTLPSYHAHDGTAVNRGSTTAAQNAEAQIQLQAAQIQLLVNALAAAVGQQGGNQQQGQAALQNPQSSLGVSSNTSLEQLNGLIQRSAANASLQQLLNQQQLNVQSQLKSNPNSLRNVNVQPNTNTGPHRNKYK